MTFSTMAELFENSGDALFALGDQTRQSIMTNLILAGCEGLRVGEITQQTHLSRPSVSHHLKILKEAKLVNLYTIGTKNYYYVDAESTSLIELKSLFVTISDFIGELKQNGCLNCTNEQIEGAKK